MRCGEARRDEVKASGEWYVMVRYRVGNLERVITGCRSATLIWCHKRESRVSIQPVRGNRGGSQFNLIGYSFVLLAAVTVVSTHCTVRLN